MYNFCTRYALLNHFLITYICLAICKRIHSQKYTFKLEIEISSKYIFPSYSQQHVRYFLCYFLKYSFWWIVSLNCTLFGIKYCLFKNFKRKRSSLENKLKLASMQKYFLLWAVYNITQKQFLTYIIWLKRWKLWLIWLTLSFDKCVFDDFFFVFHI